MLGISHSLIQYLLRIYQRPRIKTRCANNRNRVENHQIIGLNISVILTCKALTRLINLFTPCQHKVSSPRRQFVFFQNTCLSKHLPLPLAAIPLLKLFPSLSAFCSFTSTYLYNTRYMQQLCLAREKEKPFLSSEVQVKSHLSQRTTNYPHHALKA